MAGCVLPPEPPLQARSLRDGDRRQNPDFWLELATQVLKQQAGISDGARRELHCMHLHLKRQFSEAYPDFGGQAEREVGGILHAFSVPL